MYVTYCVELAYASHTITYFYIRRSLIDLDFLPDDYAQLGYHKHRLRALKWIIGLIFVYERN